MEMECDVAYYLALTVIWLVWLFAVTIIFFSGDLIIDLLVVVAVIVADIIIYKVYVKACED